MFNRSMKTPVRSLGALLLAAGLAAGGLTACDSNKGNSGEEKSTANAPEKAESEGSSEKSGETASAGDKKAKAGGAKKPGGANKPGGAMPGGPGGAKPTGDVTDEELEKMAQVGKQMRDYQKELGPPSGDGKKAKLQRMMKMKKKMQTVLKDVGLDKKSYRKIAMKMKGDKEAQMELKKRVEGMENSGGSGSEADAG
jgi:hypothetical protein